MYKCYDCQKKLKVKKGELIDGKMLEFKPQGESVFIFKCDDCYKKSPALTNYHDCEVYSRVVGYIRPVQQWHPGKQEEFKDRVEYKL